MDEVRGRQETDRRLDDRDWTGAPRRAVCGQRRRAGTGPQGRGAGWGRAAASFACRQLRSRGRRRQGGCDRPGQGVEGRPRHRPSRRADQRHPAAQPEDPLLQRGHVHLVQVGQPRHQSVADLRVPQRIRVLGPHPHPRDRQTRGASRRHALPGDQKPGPVQHQAAARALPVRHPAPADGVRGFPQGRDRAQVRPRHRPGGAVGTARDPRLGGRRAHPDRRLQPIRLATSATPGPRTPPTRERSSICR